MFRTGKDDFELPIHPTAIIDPQAQIDPTANIGPFVVIQGPVQIASQCIIGPSVVLLGHTSIGPRTHLHAHAVIGDLPQDRAYEGSTSFCHIGADSVLREGVTVHRGTSQGSETVVGDRCLLMTNSHIGHNCMVGDDVTLVSGALLGGHVEIGKGVIFSGNAAAHQHVRVGELAMISGLAKLVKDVPPFTMCDRDGKIVGINRVGLKRAGISAIEREEIESFHRLLFRSDIPWQRAISTIRDTAKTAAAHRFLAFLDAPSVKGVARAPRSRRVKPVRSDGDVPES